MDVKVNRKKKIFEKVVNRFVQLKNNTYVCFMNIKPQLRKFLGKTENFKDKKERRFNQKMLKAYLKGAEFFKDGLKPNPKGAHLPWVPNMVEVKQEYL